MVKLNAPNRIQTYHLDFSVPPFDDAVSLLKRIGRTIIDDLLFSYDLGSPAEILSLKDLRILMPPAQFESLMIETHDERPPNPLKTLMSLFKALRRGGDSTGASIRKALDEIANWVVFYWRRLLGHQSPSTVDVNITEDFIKRIIKQIIKARTPPADLKASLEKPMVQLFGGISPVFLPLEFWQTASEIAWRDRRFQRDVAQSLLRYFRHRTLFASEANPVIVLSPKTLWLLLAISTTEPRFLLQCIASHQKGFLKTSRRVQKIAAQEILNTGAWAGFWDQWIIWKMLYCHPMATEALSVQLRAALFALPIFNYMNSADLVSGGTGDDEEPDDALPVLTVLNWREEIPDWFAIYKAFIQNTKG